ncbi:PTS sugar transporter subunit IIC [Corynebacterium yudongzhengii]|uniref:PTS sugar transporter subunit IIC n=1 Tax=Corynebacterium yudongzhengii TaxID=2080740 RepID=A0A2U1T9A3_9CORY|nr:PTS sugar transporter subunit IIC [Corynebacterium yudongzhengii]AWB82486.1 PTS sugar transporter subunit IIC [Corynebacterium yudongzhengii]PWC02458.1 PTS sugar transporter subunit IIC [Corynebacterium yudongzhengii]
MDYSIIQILLIFVWTFIVAIDQFDFLESLYQPIVTDPIIGLILGDLETGLIVGGTYQLITIGLMPIGGAQPPNAVIGGIMATIFAVSLDLPPEQAVATAIPFALLGQYGVTLLFTARAPMIEKFREAAIKADPSRVLRWTIISEVILGLIFASVVTLFFIGGLGVGEQIVSAFPDWLNNGLEAAGGMMRFVGFAILLKIMMNGDMWAFFIMGFGIAAIVGSIDALSSSALLILAFIGFGLAFWDYQQQTKLKGAAASSEKVTDGI